MEHQYEVPNDFSSKDADAINGRVTAVHRGMWEVGCAHGTVPAVLKSGAYYGEEQAVFPAVGDYVSLVHNPHGESLIIETHPRRSKFSRNDFSGHAAGYAKTVLEQVVAANFDYVFIMASLNHDFHLGRIERYLVQGWQSGGTPVIVLTKADLVEDFAPQLAAVEQLATGVDVVPVSARTGFGLDRLEAYTRPGKTIVFLGSSGVGKSSLVNALAGEDVMRVNTIREDDSKGRHTTTHRQLIPLPCGALIIDTPGMRELGMWDAQEGISGAFGDIEELIARCRFSDCGHDTEPGCAVKAALAEGSLTAERWKRYLQLCKEAKFVTDKAAYQREQTQWHKGIQKALRQNRRDKDQK